TARQAVVRTESRTATLGGVAAPCGLIKLIRRSILLPLVTVAGVIVWTGLVVISVKTGQVDEPGLGSARASRASLVPLGASRPRLPTACWCRILRLALSSQVSGNSF